MMRFVPVCLGLLCVVACIANADNVNNANNKPNIIVIIADDLGWADVGYHNKNISTPNIDQLATIRLENYYTHPTCTPSRSALMTGKYSFYTGLHNAMLGLNPHGLDDHHPTIAQRLKAHSYTSYYIGKWHLGHAKTKYTPLYKGFDYFYGIYNGMANNYEQRLETFLDLHENNDVMLNHNKLYSTHLYTQKTIEKINEFSTDNDRNSSNSTNLFMVLSYQALHTPLEVPESYLSTGCKHIINANRKNYCGMLMTVDESIKNITETLKQNGMWNNTIVFFTTDNGGQTWSGALNYPYRGMKHTLYEGGVKGVAFFGGGYFDNAHDRNDKQTGGNYYGLMHISDVAPTLLGFINNTSHDVKELDDNSGDNMAKFIMNSQSKSNKIVVPFLLDGQITARDGRYKIIDSHHGDSYAYENYDNSTLIGDGFVDKLFYFFTELIPEDAIFWKEIVREARLIPRHMVRGFTTSEEVYQIYDLDTDPYEKVNLCSSGKNVEWCKQTHQQFITRIYNHVNISKVYNYPFDDMDPAYKHNCNNVYNQCFSNSWIQDDVDIKTLRKTNFLRFYVKRWMKQQPWALLKIVANVTMSNYFLLITCIFVMYVSIEYFVTKKYWVIM